MPRPTTEEGPSTEQGKRLVALLAEYQATAEQDYPDMERRVAATEAYRDARQTVRGILPMIEAEAAAPVPALDDLLGEVVNALEWCDARYRQTLAGKPVKDVPEMRAYINATLTKARARLAARPVGEEQPCDDCHRTDGTHNLNAEH